MIAIAVVLALMAITFSAEKAHIRMPFVWPGLRMHEHSWNALGYIAASICWVGAIIAAIISL